MSLAGEDIFNDLSFIIIVLFTSLIKLEFRFRFISCFLAVRGEPCILDVNPCAVHIFLINIKILSFYSYACKDYYVLSLVSKCERKVWRKGVKKRGEVMGKGSQPICSLFSLIHHKSFKFFYFKYCANNKRIIFSRFVKAHSWVTQWFFIYGSTCKDEFRPVIISLYKLCNVHS